jgi:hypothetical protein
MRRVASILIVLLCIACGSAAAQSSGVDAAASDKLTKYLHKNRLPMVGAQVLNTSSGRRLMLYGYVATDFGKTDAVTKSKRYLQDSSISVVNNIQVNPQVRHLKRQPDQDAPAQMGDSNRMPPRADWENTFDDTLRTGGATPSNDPALKMPPPGGPAPVPPGSSW